MLLHICAARSSYRHVIQPHLRATSAFNVSRSNFVTTARLSNGRTSDDAFHLEKRLRNDATPPCPSRRTGASSLDEEQAPSGEYTSLTTKLDHYPYSTLPPSSNPSSRPQYQHYQTPLSSILPPSHSPNHNSQRTFLTHSRRTRLNPASTVFTGTRYEYITLSSLRRVGIELARVGGSGDKGVDLVGWWHLPQWTSMFPPNPPGGQDGGTGNEKVGERIRAVVQCKRISPTARASKTVGPSVVRELEGAFRGAPAGWRNGNGVLGLLVSTRAATKGVMEGMGRSEKPLGWVLLEEVEEGNGKDAEVDKEAEESRIARDADGEEGDDVDASPAQEYSMVKGRIKQILWNQKAKELGLEGLDVVKRYGSDGQTDAGDEVILMWKGKPVEGLPPEDE